MTTAAGGDETETETIFLCDANANANDREGRERGAARRDATRRRFGDDCNTYYCRTRSSRRARARLRFAARALATWRHRPVRGCLGREAVFHRRAGDWTTLRDVHVRCRIAIRRGARVGAPWTARRAPPPAAPPSTPPTPRPIYGDAHPDVAPPARRVGRPRARRRPRRRLAVQSVRPHVDEHDDREQLRRAPR